MRASEGYTPTSPTDAVGSAELQHLVKQCCGQDRRAQKQFYDLYSPLIFGIIRRYTSDRAIAEEIHSAACYKILKCLDQYRFQGAIEGWMRKITVHVISDHFRKNHRTTELMGADTEDIPAALSETGFSKLAYRDLLQLIQELPETQRTVFNLFVFEECSHKEIAELIGIQENNSRWHLNDARRRLKEQINATNR
ncbi:MAG: sigma-70 family RNA polymerase sigma factor [Bacteroidetes bacterium]|nr:sigma-70 family RNA polymerase sigma factor [Bacteroidota bacterium]